MAGLLIPANAGTADAVTETLRRWAREPFDVLTANCGLSVLDYAERATANAPLVRPRALTRRDVRRLIARPHVFEAYCGAILADLGLTPTLLPGRGDIGLIELANGLTAALCLGDGCWAARGLRGVVMQPAPFRRAWGVQCRTR